MPVLIIIALIVVAIVFNSWWSGLEQKAKMSRETEAEKTQAVIECAGILFCIGLHAGMNIDIHTICRETGMSYNTVDTRLRELRRSGCLIGMKITDKGNYALNQFLGQGSGGIPASKTFAG